MPPEPPRHLPIVHHPAYDARFDPAHRFPMGKFGMLAHVLREDGLVPDGFHVPGVATVPWVARVHDPAYVARVFNAACLPSEEKRIGFPVDERVARRSRRATAGTWLAARLALRHGLACNTAGGSHHAGPEGGAGFCVFNDVAVAASALLATGDARRVAVLDLDVHQGDGTARIFADEPRVLTVSLHAARNYPDKKAKSDIDLALPDGTDDDDYLAALRTLLPAVAEFAPDLAFLNAGVDPHHADRLGRLALTDEGLARRDALAIGHLRDRGIPVAGVLGGGYGRELRVLARRHATLHRAASERWAAERTGAAMGPADGEAGEDGGADRSRVMA